MIEKKEALGMRILPHTLCTGACLLLTKENKTNQLITATDTVWDHGNVSQKGVDSREGMEMGKLMRKRACEKTRSMCVHDCIDIISLLITRG